MYTVQIIISLVDVLVLDLVLDTSVERGDFFRARAAQGALNAERTSAPFPKKASALIIRLPSDN